MPIFANRPCTLAIVIVLMDGDRNQYHDILYLDQLYLISITDQLLRSDIFNLNIKY